MIFNETHRKLTYCDLITQEQIYEAPGVFAMSMDEVIASARVPPWMKQICFELPFSGKRPTVIQIRPQDFRHSRPTVLGDGWHIDSNVRLNDGVERVASSLTDWQLYVVSFGDVCQTEFMGWRMNLDETMMGDISQHGKFFSGIGHLTGPIDTAADRQIMAYTSRDIHRAGTAKYKPGMRLVVIAFESSDVVGKGVILPSIAEQERSGGKLATIEDHTT